MTEEQIEKRILVCEKKEREYREIDRNTLANKYLNEKYKWEALLDKINPRRDKQLEDYKDRCYYLEKRIENIITFIKNRKEYGINVEISDVLEMLERSIPNDR